MVELRTRSKGITFGYETTADGSIHIEFGRGNRATLKATDYTRVIDHFQGQTVALGTSRDNPPPGSVGKWLQENVTRTAIASYLGPILVHEGQAVWVDGSTLQFTQH
jgi:hypothetical protein